MTMSEGGVEAARARDMLGVDLDNPMVDDDDLGERLMIGLNAEILFLTGLDVGELSSSISTFTGDAALLLAPLSFCLNFNERSSPISGL